MTNNYNLELIKERIEEDKFTIRYGNIYLPEELIVEAYDTIKNQKSLEYDAKMMIKCREACKIIKHHYPDTKLKIHKNICEVYGDEDWFIYHEKADENINELLGQILLDLFFSDDIWSICITQCSYLGIDDDEGEFYER